MQKYVNLHGHWVTSSSAIFPFQNKWPFLWSIADNKHKLKTSLTLLMMLSLIKNIEVERKRVLSLVLFFSFFLVFYFLFGFEYLCAAHRAAVMPVFTGGLNTVRMKAMSTLQLSVCMFMLVLQADRTYSLLSISIK